MSDNRPIVYREGSRWVFRASSVGRSIRDLAAAMQGYSALPPPEYLLKAADAGSRAEVDVKKRLVEAHGFTLRGDQDLIEVPVGDEAIIRGHLDGFTIIRPDYGDRMLEVKSMSARVFAKWTAHRFNAFPEYAAQLTCYMQGTGKKAIYAVINRETQELEIIPIDEPPVSWAVVQSRVLQAVYYTSRGELPECDSASTYSCPYEYLCTRRPLISDEVESGTAEILARLAHDYDELRKLEQELKDRKAMLREDILKSLAGRENVQTGRWSFAVSNPTKKTLDVKALRDRLGNELDEFYKTSSYEQLRVTERGV